MSKIFYTSDLHFGHGNIIAFDNRPFHSTEEMERVIVARWNERVAPGDRVYILGDFCWNTGAEWDRILKKLNGEKHLILGNHDGRRMTASTKKLFAGIYDYKEIDDNGRTVIMSHYPMPFYRADYNKNTYHLYGHVHVTIEEDLMQEIRAMIMRRDKRGFSQNKCQFYNAWCGYYHYAPATLDEIIEFWHNKIEEYMACSNLTESALSRIKQSVKDERDLLLAQIHGDCRYCVHRHDYKDESICYRCSHLAAKEKIEGDYWAWDKDAPDKKGGEPNA